MMAEKQPELVTEVVVQKVAEADVEAEAEVEQEGSTWVDDERASSSAVGRPCRRIDPASRPLWQDVLWGRERGHESLFEAWECDDRSNYVDYDFDSGLGSPVAVDDFDE